MLEFFTVSFFGHRYIDDFFDTEQKLIRIVEDLLQKHGFIEFLVGRHGDFDDIVSSVLHNLKKEHGESFSHVLVLPYPTKKYPIEELEAYYDYVEICEKAAAAHPKSAIQIRNRVMVDRSDLVVFHVYQNHGGAYKTLKYAQQQEKAMINVSQYENTEIAVY